MLFRGQVRAWKTVLGELSRTSVHVVSLYGINGRLGKTDTLLTPVSVSFASRYCRRRGEAAETVVVAKPS